MISQDSHIIPISYIDDTGEASKISSIHMVSILTVIMAILLILRMIALYITDRQIDKISQKNYTCRSTDIRRHIDFTQDETKPIIRTISNWNKLTHSHFSKNKESKDVLLKNITTE